MKEEITLVGKGERALLSDKPIAFSYVTYDGDGQGGYRASTGGGGVQNSCSGNPCQCCEFVWETYLSGWLGKQEFRRIKGCNCIDNPIDENCYLPQGGLCNHTITIIN